MVEDNFELTPRQTFYDKGHFVDAFKEFDTKLKWLLEGWSWPKLAQKLHVHASIDNGFTTRKLCNNHTFIHRECEKP